MWVCVCVYICFLHERHRSINDDVTIHMESLLMNVFIAIFLEKYYQQLMHALSSKQYRVLLNSK